MVARERFELSSAGPEPAILDRSVNWQDVRSDFIVWADGRFRARYVKDLRNILDKHEPVITRAQDVDRLLAGQFPGRRHLWFGIRALLKFCGSHGWPRSQIEGLKEAMPPCPKAGKCKIIPKEDAVLELLRDLRHVPGKYQVFYDVVLDGAIRPTHAIEILGSWTADKLEHVGSDAWQYSAEIEREQKHTWILMLTDQTVKEISQLVEAPTEIGYLRMKQSHNLLRPKFTQKFAYNMMRKHGVEVDVAEFLSGRWPQGVGAQHYAELVSLAAKQYPRYARYVKGLREKALSVH